ncbi:MAG TPA: hypothetical protein VHP38_06725 [Ruminiclostridium sp.]|nr:hypothetical protein [Ruminiclostridium sp.]
MYGFPDQKILDAINGETLTMVCCNANQIYLHFDLHVSIAIENSFQVKTDNELVQVQIPVDNLIIFKLLEIKVAKVSKNQENSILELGFENGWNVVLFDDQHYESHTITVGKKEYFV